MTAIATKPRPWMEGQKPGTAPNAKTLPTVAPAKVKTLPTVPPKAKAEAAPVADPLTPKPGSNSAALIDELAQVRADKSKLDKRDKELTAMAKEQLGDGEHRGGKAMLVITTDDRDTFDGKRFKADHPDFHAKYSAPKPVTTVSIKPLL